MRRRKAHMFAEWAAGLARRKQNPSRDRHQTAAKDPGWPQPRRFQGLSIASTRHDYFGLQSSRYGFSGGSQ